MLAPGCRAQNLPPGRVPAETSIREHIRAGKPNRVTLSVAGPKPKIESRSSRTLHLRPEMLLWRKHIVYGSPVDGLMVVDQAQLVCTLAGRE